MGKRIGRLAVSSRIFAVRNVFACLFLFLFILAATNASAQRLTGGLSVQILDPAGKVVPAAKVSIVNKVQGTNLGLTSGADGSLPIPDLAPGEYEITVTHEGFNTVKTTAPVRVGVTSTITISLELGAVSSIIEVEASAITVDTTMSTVQGVIDSNLINSLPLNGRNFLDLAQLEPGVQIVDGGLFDPTKNQMVGVSVGGQSGRSTRIQVDGVDITDETVGTTVMNLSNEAVQEFGVAQSSLDVSTDLTTSGSINIITKSGKNAVHGDGFGFFRRSSFAADPRLGTQTTPKPPTSRDNYGGSLGGPFFKDKWFWEVEYEALTQAGQAIVSVPSFPQFNGSFAVPLKEHMGGARTDFNITQSMKMFYRWNHDDNIGVTGFGGVGSSAFANSNSANSHVVGWDDTTPNWAHSVRFSFLKFINGIVDGNALAGTPVGNAQINITGLGGFVYGPNPNAPQATYQQNRQIKYDATRIIGRHQLAFGAEYNRIDQAGFATFFGLGPRVQAAFSGGVAAVPFNSNGASDPLNYKVTNIRIGNGLGALSEKPGLGFNHGGFANNRIGIYAHDAWRVSNNFTLNGGLRYDRDDGLSNSDLPRAPQVAQFSSQLAQTPRNDNFRLGPQVGFSWNVRGNGKTVIRGGGGMYYGGNIFNNLSFDRQNNLSAGFGEVDFNRNGSSSGSVINDPITGAVLFDYSTMCTGAQGLSANSCFGAPVGRVVPFAVQAEKLLIDRSAEAAKNYPAPGALPLWVTSQGASGGDMIEPFYKSPYALDLNIGVQRELKPGLVLSADYVMIRGVHLNTVIDRNRIGAADTLNIPAGQAAMAATFSDFECGNATVSANVDCVIEGGGTILDFANNGLGAGTVSGTTNTSAFGGVNRNFTQVNVIEPLGLSRYQGLQVRLTGKVGDWGPFKNTITNVTYALSRFKSTVADGDFIYTAVNNDNPTGFYGPVALDRTHNLGISVVTQLPWGFNFSTTSYYRSNEASYNGILLQATSGSAAEIFFTDLNGDGTIGDPLPGTTRGAFGRSVTPGNLNTILQKYNTNVAGTLAPAAQALVSAGLFSSAQLTNLGAVIQSVDLAPAGQLNNSPFFTTDIRLSWRYKLLERFSIEPMVECFNLFNIANMATGVSSTDRGANTGLDGLLSTAPGSINGTAAYTSRVGAGTGSFSSGTPRSFQFGIRVTY